MVHRVGATGVEDPLQRPRGGGRHHVVGQVTRHLDLDAVDRVVGHGGMQPSHPLRQIEDRSGERIIRQGDVDGVGVALASQDGEDLASDV